MACAVLAPTRYVAAIFVLVVAFLSVSAGTMDRQAGQCPPGSALTLPPTRQNQVQQFRQLVETGFFYRKLTHQLGTPQACGLELDTDNIKLSYSFRGNAHLEARINPSIEYSEQRLQLWGIKPKKALALLKEGARDAFGRDGCRIDWSRPTEELPGKRVGSREILYRGDVCNCQARVIYQDDSIMALVLSSAC